MRTADVVVVGGGPAGASVATWLARAGREVLLVDRARFPRDKCCGDGLTTGALRSLERLGLSPAAVPSWQPVEDVAVRSPSGRVVRFPLPRGAGAFAAVAPRAELDLALLGVARAAGVEVCEGHGLSGASSRDDRVVLEVDGLGAVSTRYAIGADGMWSPLRRALGASVPGYRGEWHAFRQYVSSVGPGAGDLWVWFEPDLLPGYAWSFPLPGGRANVGLAVQRGARGGVAVGDMGAAWSALLARPHVRSVLGPGATLEGSVRAWPIPARVGELALSAGGGRALFVGDAAAATDPLTGEGIGQALLTGELAARAVVAAGALRPSVAASSYASSVRRELVADARMSRVLVPAVARSLGVRGAVRAAGLSGWTRAGFARWLFEDYPRAFVATPGRWREHSMVGSGAWA